MLPHFHRVEQGQTENQSAEHTASILPERIRDRASLRRIGHSEMAIRENEIRRQEACDSTVSGCAYSSAQWAMRASSQCSGLPPQAMQALWPSLPRIDPSPPQLPWIRRPESITPIAMPAMTSP